MPNNSFKVKHGLDVIGNTVVSGDVQINSGTTSSDYPFSIGSRFSFRGDGVFNWGSSAAHGQFSWDGSNAIITSLGSYGLQLKSSTGTIYVDDHINLPDNQYIKLGTGNDLQIYHNGTDSFITNTNGDLQLRSTSKNIILGNTYDSWTYFGGTAGGRIRGGSNEGYLYLQAQTGSNSIIVLATDSTDRWKIDGSGHLLPNIDSTYNIGSTSVRMSNVFTDNLFISSYIQIDSISTTIDVANFRLRKGNDGEAHLDTPGSLYINLDTNNNNSDRIFGIRTDSATTGSIFSVDESGNLTAANDIYASGTSYWGDLKEIVRFSDSWLRLNPDNDFTNGIYVSGFFRVDGGLQIGTTTTSGIYIPSDETTFQWKGEFVATQTWVTNQGYITEAQDNQTLSWNGSTSQLTISGTGNTVTVDYDDNEHFYVGTGNDIDIYHDGSNSYIKNNIGDLYIGNYVSSNLAFVTSSTVKWIIDSNGDLLPNVSNTYDIGSNSNRVQSISVNNIYTYTGIYPYVNDTGYLIRSYNTSASNAEQFSIQHSAGNVNIENLRGNINILAPTTFSENLSILSDSKKLYLGAGSDLQIYHNGTNSILENVTGYMIIGNYHSSNLYFKTNEILRWMVDTTGHFVPVADSTYNIGTASIRVANGYFDVLYAGSSVLQNNILTMENDNSWVYFKNVGLSGGIKLGTNNASDVYTDLMSLSATGQYVKIHTNIKLDQDSKYLYLGASDDMLIGHDGSNCYFSGSTGSLYLRNVADANIYFLTNNTTRWYVSNTGHIIPYVDSTYNIGSDTARVSEVFVDNLNLVGVATARIFGESSDLVLYQGNSSNDIELRGCGNVLVNIDSNNNETDRKFHIIKNSATEVFSVNESAEVRMQTIIITDSSGNDKWKIYYDPVTDSLITDKI